MRANSATVTIGILLLTLFAPVSRPDTLIMPRELVDFAHANGCTPNDDFYNRPGMVNPPFVYGLVSGNQEDSAVFWCRKLEKSDRPYNLMFKARDPKQLAGCPAVIEWWNPPRGLSIETRRTLALSDFRYVASPKQAGPAIAVSSAKLVLSSYDGITDAFYCYKEQWLVKSTE